MTIKDKPWDENYRVPLQKNRLLLNHCKHCHKKKKCDASPPHPYNNPIWHGCSYKNAIVELLLGGGSDDNRRHSTKKM